MQKLRDPTIVIFQKQDCRFQYCGFVHLSCICANHAAELVYKHVELISAFLLAKITRFSKTY